MVSIDPSISVRPAAVAGMFYPADPRGLAREVDLLVGQAPRPALDPLRSKAVAVPHAGYVYSGETAGCAYALIAQRRDAIRRVVLLGPTHRVAVTGLALPDAGSFDSPLGHFKMVIILNFIFLCVLTFIKLKINGKAHT